MAFTSTSIMLMNGKATEALEKASKKRKLAEPVVFNNDKLASFNLTELFHSVTPDEEAFPALTWDFDEDDNSSSKEETQATIITADLFSQTNSKRNHSTPSLYGMRRSKSIKRSLEEFVSSTNLEPQPALTLNKILTLNTLKRVQTIMSAPDLHVKSC